MIFLEAKKLSHQVELIRSYLSGGGICINIGSSDTTHLESQPYIRDLLYDKIEEVGLKLTHIDNKNGSGVNVVADLSDTNDRERLLKLNARLILANNILEHLKSPAEGIEWLSDICPHSSILIISGPQLYPYHPDPIDNRFRPSQRRIKRLVGSGFQILRSESFFGGTVLVANEPKSDRKRSYEWLRTRFSRHEFRNNPMIAFRGLFHAIYPTRCYIVVLRKI